MTYITRAAQRLKEQSKDVNGTREQQFSVYVSLPLTIKAFFSINLIWIRYVSGANEARMRQLQVLLLFLNVSRSKV